MSGFDELDALEWKTMAVFRDNKSGGNVLPQQFLDDLCHPCGSLAGSNHDQPAANRHLFAGHRKLAMGDLNKITDAGGRTCSVQSGFPDLPCRLAKFADVHCFAASSPFAILSRISSIAARSFAFGFSCR